MGLISGIAHHPAAAIAVPKGANPANGEKVFASFFKKKRFLF